MTFAAGCSVFSRATLGYSEEPASVLYFTASTHSFSYIHLTQLLKSNFKTNFFATLVLLPHLSRKKNIDIYTNTAWYKEQQ